MEPIEFQGESDERRRDWRAFLFQKGYKEENRHTDTLGDFILDGMLSWGIRLRYIGANTTLLGGTEYAIELVDYRKECAQTSNVSFNEYVWDEMGLEAIAQKHGIDIVELDEVAGNDLRKYRHGGERYSGDEKEYLVLFVKRRDQPPAEGRWIRGQRKQRARKKRWNYPEQTGARSGDAFSVF